MESYCYGAKWAVWGSILGIAGERGEVSTSNHLTFHRIPSRYLYAKFRGKRRYKNVQGQLVGANYTPRRAQVQL